MDKYYHLLAGIVIALFFSNIILYITKNTSKAIWTGIIAALVIGIGKEIYDIYFGGDVEFLDAMATWLGGFIGILFIIDKK